MRFGGDFSPRRKDAGKCRGGGQLSPFKKKATHMTIFFCLIGLIGVCFIIQSICFILSTIDTLINRIEVNAVVVGNEIEGNTGDGYDWYNRAILSYIVDGKEYKTMNHERTDPNCPLAEGKIVQIFCHKKKPEKSTTKSTLNLIIGFVLSGGELFIGIVMFSAAIRELLMKPPNGLN